MRKVFKYAVQIEHRQTLLLPAGAQILAFQGQDNPLTGVPGAFIWALVDPEAPKEERVFSVVGTGHDVEDGLAYIGTIQGGPWVWHLFERTQT